MMAQLDTTTEQRDSSMRALQTAKQRMIDLDSYYEVAKDIEHMRECMNNISDEYLKVRLSGKMWIYHIFRPSYCS